MTMVELPNLIFISIYYIPPVHYMHEMSMEELFRKRFLFPLIVRISKENLMFIGFRGEYLD